MGATPEMKGANYDEKPAHTVTLTHDYYIGKTEVTRGLWRAVMGSYPGEDQKENADNKPVSFVSWTLCQEFIGKINELTGKNFRLPTEAEWEFAARGGNKSRHCQFSGSNDVDEVAWHNGNCGEPQDVATKKPNELGIYDMSGNVYEWCSDEQYYYESSAQTDPQGKTEDFHGFRVYRDGSWLGMPETCRISRRSFKSCDGFDVARGLRLVFSE